MGRVEKDKSDTTHATGTDQRRCRLRELCRGSSKRRIEHPRSFGRVSGPSCHAGKGNIAVEFHSSFFTIHGTLYNILSKSNYDVFLISCSQRFLAA